MDFFQLRNGNKLPKICFGPGIMERDVCYSSNKFVKFLQRKRLEQDYYSGIKSCLMSGVRFIDYSAAYGREDIIRKAMHNLHIDRNELFLTTRVSNKSQYGNQVRESALRSIEKFGTEYVDLLMFHWPVADHYVDTWKELIKMRDEGYCRNIGVANCHQNHIETLIKETGVCPDINQIEIHPLFTQKPLLIYCQHNGIQIEAYTPLARMDGRLTRLPKLKSICKNHNKTISQVVLRWHIQNGIIPVSVHGIIRIKENLWMYSILN